MRTKQGILDAGKRSSTHGSRLIAPHDERAFQAIGSDPSTIVRVEAGAKTYAMTLRQLQATFEAEGVVFLDPVEGVHQGAVGLKWGVELPQRSANSSAGSGEGSQGGSGISAAPSAWDEG